MKVKYFTVEATPKDRFKGVFFLLLAAFSVGYVLRFTFSDAPSNIIWHGEDVRGWRLLVGNCLFIPLISALLAASAGFEVFLKERIRRARQEKES